MTASPSMFFLYGPPGSGKSTLGCRLAARLGLSFVDVDEEIERQAGRTVRELFEAEGESGFRAREAAVLRTVVERGPGVVALGGGALLDERSRALVEAAGTVLCMDAALEVLVLAGAQARPGQRPLLGQEPEAYRTRLEDLLARRKDHYASFRRRVRLENTDWDAALDRVQTALGAFHLGAMGNGCDIRVRPGGLEDLGTLFRERGWKGNVALVADTNTSQLYGARAVRALEGAGLKVTSVVLPAGEAHKTIETVGRLWTAFVAGGLDRGDTVVGLGGGVVTDLAGFAAATYLRGVRWVAVPTTLLGMVDASLGGKTGADLPEGKNLIGAFHSPALVLADPLTLETLPDEEFRSGLAEVVKHGLLQDPELFAHCAGGWTAVRQGDTDALVRRAMAVKVRYVETDPFEKNIRAALNLGHTVGHALEKATDYALRHGEGVAIGLVAEARIAEQMGLAEAGLADRIREVLSALGLPVAIPAGLDRGKAERALMLDKKRAGGLVRFALPVRVGEARVGVTVDPALCRPFE